MYWKDRDYDYKGDILLFNTKTKKEEICSTQYIHKKFPVPPPFSMWRTPFGHLSQYDVSIFSYLDECENEKNNYL